MDTLAARLREAFLGTETGEAVPFDELKDAVRDRWQRVADAARQVPPEGIALAAARERGHRAALRVPSVEELATIGHEANTNFVVHEDAATAIRDAVLAGLPTGEHAPIRVPFSDAQIERMAEAAHTRRMRDEERTKHWKDLPLFAKDAWRQGIRAALAAGGLEPCAVPEYDPADVALAPTGRVLRDRLVEAEAKIERQRKNLRQLYEARARDAQLIAELRAEVDEDNAAAASVNALLVQVQNLTAERDRLRVGWENSHKAEEELETALAQLGAQEIELADLRFYQREFASVSAERDALKAHRRRVQEDLQAFGPEEMEDTAKSIRKLAYELTSQNEALEQERDALRAKLQPTDQVEALARVLEEATAEGFEEEHRTYMRRHARAAIAHLSTRPEGLPTADDLWRLICSIEEMQYDWKGIEYIELEQGDMSNLLTALRPWLRDPVGCELDVTAEEVFDEGCRAYMQSSGITTKPEMDRDDRAEVQAVIDLCRSRIRPVFECKECAKKDTRIDMYDRQQNMMAKSIEVQRQGLERAAAAARAALEGE